jgi:putative FmdB family regulatory protein
LPSRFCRAFDTLNGTLTPSKTQPLFANRRLAPIRARGTVQYAWCEIVEPRGRIEMALYEYKCAGCEDRFDLMRPMSDADEPAECPECGSTESRRVISNFASITPGASAVSTNPVMDARMASGGGGGCCGGGCGCG